MDAQKEEAPEGAAETDKNVHTNSVLQEEKTKEREQTPEWKEKEAVQQTWKMGSPINSFQILVLVHSLFPPSCTTTPV